MDAQVTSIEAAVFEFRFEQIARAFSKIPLVDPEHDIHRRFVIGSLSSVDMEGDGLCPVRFRSKRGRGRPENLRAKAVTILTEYGFMQSTCRRGTLIVPTIEDLHRAHGAYLDLLTEVFRILGLPQNPEHYAKRYCNHLRKAKLMPRRSRKRQESKSEDQSQSDSNAPPNKLLFTDAINQSKFQPFSLQECWNAQEKAPEPRPIRRDAAPVVPPGQPQAQSP